jgi:hypothetical protein
MKKLFASVILVFIATCISSTSLFASIPYPGDDDDGTGGSGGGTSSYVVDYETIGTVLQANGYSTSYVSSFISASAISPSGTCQVVRDHYSTVKITIYTQDTGTIYYDLFMKFNINGTVKELRVINSVYAYVQ